MLLSALFYDAVVNTAFVHGNGTLLRFALYDVLLPFPEARWVFFHIVPFGSLGNPLVCGTSDNRLDATGAFVGALVQG